MKDKCFIDTNILIYLYSADEIQKREKVERLLDESGQALISTQVVNEFVNVMHKKRSVDFAHIAQSIKELMSYFTIVFVNLATIEQALFIAAKYKYSYFDSLILSSALENECTIIYTEDMHINQVIEGDLKIVNPFNV